MTKRGVSHHALLWLAASAGLVMACDDPVSDRPASLSYISAAILEPNCATSGCHSQLAATEGVQLHSVEAARVFLLTGDLVVPGQPQRSRLMYLLEGEQTERMPPDQPLPDADIELIERWILEGARDN